MGNDRLRRAPTVLFTFYPPLTAAPSFYIGLVLVVAGSWIWCWIMMVAMIRWKRANPGLPVPLAMFATVANGAPCSAMPHLWLDVCRNDGEWSDDDEGTDLSSADEAGQGANQPCLCPGPW